MATTSYSLSEIVTQKHTTDAKRMEAAQELALIAVAFYFQLRKLEYDASAARQLTAVMVAGISGGKSAG
jgi:hypothetical protein